MLELSFAHLTGYGVEKSQAEFERFLTETVERGNVTGTIFYGLALLNGLVSSDLIQKISLLG